MSLRKTRKDNAVSRDFAYRITEGQERYVNNLFLERKRKNKNVTTLNRADVMRDLLELGIKEHRMERREKYEMSGYFRAELRTFTENFFKENNDNFIYRLTELRRNLKFVVLLLIESLKVQLEIYIMTAESFPFDEDDTDEQKKEYFNRTSGLSSQKHKHLLESIYKEMGDEGKVLIHEKNLREGKIFESDLPENSSSIK